MSALFPAVKKPGFLEGVPVKATSQPKDFARPTPPPVAHLEATPLPPLPSPPVIAPEPPAPQRLEASLLELAPAPRPSPPRVGADAVEAVAQLERERQRLTALARADALEVGFMVAERILAQELSTNPRALLELVRTAMQRLADSRELSVTVSPADHARLTELVASGQAAAIAKVRLDADPALQPGDCRVRSELGSVDGGARARLDEVRRSLASLSGDGQ